jgi:hypothetical protein
MDRFREDDSVQVFISTDAGGVGLNLQSASVLVNLDIPWNPAVLDQRIARIHRLGQSRRVQIILIVAPASYEERVLELVQGKRALFDNVVDPEASEDVVGVSKRLAEVLAEDLTGGGAEAGSQPTTEAEGATGVDTRVDPALSAELSEALSEDLAVEASAGAGETGSGPGLTAMPDEEVRRCVIALQGSFAGRIERILASGGGLLVVVDHTDEADDREAQAISDQVPIALIDRRTLASLRRLGAASPVAEGETLFAAAPEPSGPHPLLREARSKIDGARVLLGQAAAEPSLRGPAIDLITGALLAATALIGGRQEPPSAREAGVWLFGEAIPTGAVEQGDAALVMRALALAQGADAVPQHLVESLAADSEALVRRLAERV